MSKKKLIGIADAFTNRSLFNMKKSITLKSILRQFHSRLAALALLILCTIAGTAYGQTITSTNPNSTTAGQSITMVITGAGTNFTTVTGVYLRHSTQTATVYTGLNWNASSTTSATADFTIPPNAPLGTYRLSSYGGFVTYNFALTVGVGPGSNYGLVSGKVIIDNNSNCIEDVGDQAVSNAIITLMPGPIYITAGAQGDYSEWVPIGTYTATTTDPSGCGAWVCPVGGSHPVNIPVSLNTDAGNDFYWHSNVCADLQTSIATQPFRPGFNVNTTVIFRNNGPQMVSNAVGTYSFPQNFTFVSSTLAPTSNVNNTLTWNFPTMLAYTQQSITVTCNVPVNTQLGSPVALTSSIPGIGNDPNLSNNNATRNLVVVGSYDPNDKQVWDQNGAIAEGPVDPNTSSLSYLIRFQNTGTDTAFNIFVRDTLDTRLNAGTLRVTGASHPYQLSLTGARNVRFTFPNIMLLDSFANEPASHGWIAYSIDLNPGVPIGTTIDNRASIYFDYNAPVLTNYTHTTLCDFLNPFYTYTQAQQSFSFTGSSSTAATSWAWDFGDGGSSTLQSPTHTYAASGTYIVCMTAINACRSQSFCDTITICPALNENFGQSILGNDVSFIDMSDPSATSWAWDFGDGGTSTLQNPTHTYAVGAVYNVCLTVTNACETATTCHAVDMCVATNGAFTYAPTGLSLSFAATADPTVNSWLWDFGDGGTSTLQNPTHTYSSGGSYLVCLHVENACAFSDTCTNVTLVGIQGAQHTKFSVYPNPSAGRFTLAADLPSFGAMRLQLLDSKGAVISVSARDLPAGPFQELVDLSAHAAGLYMLQLEYAGQVVSIRLQKL